MPQLCRRIARHARQKVALLLGLSVGICLPYVTLQRVLLFPPRAAPSTPFDGWIAFSPSWVYAYASIALLVPLFPLLATCRRSLTRYARGLALLCGACFVVFLLLPVAGPRPEAVPDHDVYRLLVTWDRRFNSLPSLHAALTVYSFLFGYRILRDELGRGARAAYALGACLWGGAILYGTLATKQHWLADIPPGALLAWLGDRWAWRGAPPPEA